ncbi:hypothetical protein PR048_031170 [Dryococelus australis]|uniref:Ribosomal protein S3 n=1 Tax=Dryococelus australis TaxID=614101 RepID=A0ABQ9G4I0_9NEOP|nr:hypothetical protein PR048_031170 [Dryococelus australis]
MAGGERANRGATASPTRRSWRRYGRHELKRRRRVDTLRPSVFPIKALIREAGEVLIGVAQGGLLSVHKGEGGGLREFSPYLQRWRVVPASPPETADEAGVSYSLLTKTPRGEQTRWAGLIKPLSLDIHHRSSVFPGAKKELNRRVLKSSMRGSLSAKYRMSLPTVKPSTCSLFNMSFVMCLARGRSRILIARYKETASSENTETEMVNTIPREQHGATSSANGETLVACSSQSGTRSVPGASAANQRMGSPTSKEPSRQYCVSRNLHRFSVSLPNHCRFLQTSARRKAVDIDGYLHLQMVTWSSIYIRRSFRLNGSYVGSQWGNDAGSSAYSAVRFSLMPNIITRILHVPKHRVFKNTLAEWCREIWAALSIEVLKGDERQGSAGTKGPGKREIREKTQRPVASSGKIPTRKNPGATHVGYRTRFSLDGRREVEALHHRGYFIPAHLERCRLNINCHVEKFVFQRPAFGKRRNSTGIVDAFLKKKGGGGPRRGFGTRGEARRMTS